MSTSIILANCVFMILGDTLNADITAISDQFFLWYYTADLSMKLIYIPWLFGEDAFYNDPYNLLDLLVVTSSLADYAQTSTDLV
jgi:hypothetical protein